MLYAFCGCMSDLKQKIKDTTLGLYGLIFLYRLLVVLNASPSGPTTSTLDDSGILPSAFLFSPVLYKSSGCTYRAMLHLLLFSGPAVLLDHIWLKEKASRQQASTLTWYTQHL